MELLIKKEKLETLQLLPQEVSARLWSFLLWQGQFAFEDGCVFSSCSLIATGKSACFPFRGDSRFSVLPCEYDGVARAASTHHREKKDYCSKLLPSQLSQSKFSDTLIHDATDHHHEGQSEEVQESQADLRQSLE